MATFTLEDNGSTLTELDEWALLGNMSLANKSLPEDNSTKINATNSTASTAVEHTEVVPFMQVILAAPSLLVDLVYSFLQYLGFIPTH